MRLFDDTMWMKHVNEALARAGFTSFYSTGSLLIIRWLLSRGSGIFAFGLFFLSSFRLFLKHFFFLSSTTVTIQHVNLNWKCELENKKSKCYVRVDTFRETPGEKGRERKKEKDREERRRKRKKKREALFSQLEKGSIRPQKRLRALRTSQSTCPK